MNAIVEFPTWRTKLARNSEGVTLPTSGNAMILMDGDPALRGMLGFDELADRPVLLRSPPPAHDTQLARVGPYPRAWQSPDVELVLAYLQHETPKFARETVRSAMSACASVHRFHPVRQYLDTLVWDGRERLGKWLQATFDAPDTELNRAIGKAFLVASVRRIRQPGCKFDYMMVLEGKQGIGKSTCLSTLFGSDWFTDTLPKDLDSPDAIRNMLGKWCAEMAENDQIIRGSIEAIKAFLSRSTDRLVKKWENEAVDIPRQCIIVGTTNRDDYLRDSTGNRRFWPVECKAASPDWLQVNRDQLWAEASAVEKTGADVWLVDPAIRASAEGMQFERVAEDIWQSRIEEYISNKQDVSICEVFEHCLFIPIERQEMKASNRVGECLRKLGWVKFNVRRDGHQGKRWKRAETGTLPLGGVTWSEG